MHFLSDTECERLLEEFAYTFQPVKLKMSTLTSLTFRRCFFPLMLIQNKKTQ